MARRLRSQVIVAQQPNHIVSRGNNRRRLFSYPRERLCYIRLLFGALAAHSCTIQAICLMVNHIHLLLTPPTVEAASACMKRVNQRFAQIRNSERQGSGKLFEKRFFSAPIKNEKHLALTVMYIEANPYRAALRDSSNYPWSSRAIHSGVPSPRLTTGSAA